MKPLTISRNSGLSTKALIATISSIAVGAGLLGGLGAVYGPALLKKDSAGGRAPDTPEVVEPGKPKVGFEMGALSAADPVQSIKVTLQTGAEGADLQEKVDLHLGLGFPLRLFPLGEDKMTPSFAAFPQSSTLERGENSIPAGQSATFEFRAEEGEPGQDKLHSTPQLLKDVTVGDLQKIGFASLGQNEWILEGYRIEVNDQLLASNDSVNAQPGTIVSEKRAEMASMLPEKEALLDEIAELETYVATGLASDADKSELEAKKAEVANGAQAINELAGVTAGYYPWYDESDEGFVPAGGPASTVKTLGITLIAGGGQQPGTRNPLYIKAGGKKFQLTSEADPFSDVEVAQEFFISMADFEASPVSREDLENVGVGLIGNEERFGAIPDRAKVQRLVITADGEQIYDSERKTEDRKALEAFWLIPPAHLDDEGELVRNEETPVQKHLWISGMIAPDEPVVPVIPEEPVIPTPPDIPDVPDTPDTPDDEKDPDIPKPPPIPAPDPLSNQKTLLTGSPSGTFVPTGTTDPATGLQRGTLIPGQAGNNGFTPIRRQGTGGLNAGVFTPRPVGGGGSLTPANTAAIINALANLIRPIPARTTSSTTPTQPRVTNVKFGSGVNEVVIGQPVSVNWQVQPGSTGASTISQFQVELWGILPHKIPTSTTRTAASGGNAAVGSGVAAAGASSPYMWKLATVSTTTGTQTSIPTSISEGVLTSATGLSPQEYQLLWIRPVVTPIYNSLTLGSGTASSGSILPLISNPSKMTTQGGDFKLQPGPQQPIVQNFTSLLQVSTWGSASPTGKFQSIPPGPPGTPRTPWRNVTLVPPNRTIPASTWLLATPTSTLAALPLGSSRISPTGNGSVGGMAKYFNLAARTTTSGTRMNFMYEGFIQYPSTNTNVLRGYRLVGHAGFLSSPSTGASGSAKLGIKVDLSGSGHSANPNIAWNRQGAQGFFNLTNPGSFNPNDLERAWMRMETNTDATVTWTPGGPMKLIDVPIRFDLLDASPVVVGPLTDPASVSGYPSPKPADGFSTFTIKGGGTTQANQFTVPFSQGDLAAYNFAKSTGLRRINVTVMVTVDTSSLPSTASLGIFGLRLIPDVYK